MRHIAGAYPAAPLEPSNHPTQAAFLRRLTESPHVEGLELPYLGRPDLRRGTVAAGPDAVAGPHPPEKGYLSLEAEIEAVTAANERTGAGGASRSTGAAR